ncbi:UDP-glucose 4-epimerase GalE [Bacillus sp. S/N-304-OC-R1]|uniref:UDP-glucose 4-epimerase GalE n=1 Tax=Bacillus sp. S/N-304-OC-R1 TaxID=2758034 RepID=UPI001C8DF6FD|nr:UDP-glucose 4-epimerase GalE [Bacillus sp. S/N-304-OC-R1]MBY0124256.1 UDP-glucose 4-epimerase GalE [Bacillus sp. S/N-304-OC-R1]
MKILVTGGAGFIGTHTCVELLQSGYEVVVADNFSNSKPAALRRVSEITGKEFPIYEVDIKDQKSLSPIFSEQKIDAVIHFAGLKAVGESVAFPLRYYQNNVTGMISLCEVMDRFNVKKLVFSSSATVYGLSESVPFCENDPLQATNPYGQTKLICERILQDLFVSDHNWRIALLRYFNPVGAHSSGLIGEDPNGTPNNLFPYMSQVAVGKLKELSVFGNDYETHDGTGIRDYIHVVDLACGHIKALERILDQAGVHTYNLGTGKGYSVLEMIGAFEHATGRAIPFKFVNRRSGDIAISYADPTKAKSELKWSAEKGIDEMCNDSWRWQVMNPNGFEDVM